MNLVITCGYNQSLHTVALINELTKQNHKIIGCLTVKTYQISRFKTYLKKFGLRTVLEKYKNSVLGINSTLKKETEYIKTYIEEKNIIRTNVKSICNDLNIDFHLVANLNSTDSLKFLDQKQIDLIVYSGGGIIKNKLIEKSKFGVINAHSGELPYFRGMNVVEWSIISKKEPMVTVHMINKGIDTGDILHTKLIDYNVNDTIYDFRGKSVVEEIRLLLKVLKNFKNYYDNRIMQNRSIGKQFFVMHPILVKMLNSNLSSIMNNHFQIKKQKCAHIRNDN